MNPQTPKPEPSCPCCGSTNWFCYPEPVGNPFRHCNDCDCKWDNRKRRTLATEPGAVTYVVSINTLQDGRGIEVDVYTSKSLLLATLHILVQAILYNAARITLSTQ